MLQTDDLFLGAFGLVRGGELRGRRGARDERAPRRGLHDRRPGRRRSGARLPPRPGTRGPAAPQVGGPAPEGRGFRGAACRGEEGGCRSRRKGSSGSSPRTTSRRSSLSGGSSSRRRAGSSSAPCPFHKEKTASFNVSSAKGLFHCFGCGVSGDVIGFVTKHDKVSFGGALEALARRAGPRPRDAHGGAATDPAADAAGGAHAAARCKARIGLPKPSAEGAPPHGAPPQPSAVAFCLASWSTTTGPSASGRTRRRTSRSAGSRTRISCEGPPDRLRGRLAPQGDPEGRARCGRSCCALGVITTEGRELLGGCVVVPIPDPLTGQWTNLYGRGLRTPRHCYLPGPLRGVLNFQAARTAHEVVLTESILDALSFHQVGIAIAIPIYGTNGFTPDHLDLLKRERVKRVDPRARQRRRGPEGQRTH